MKKYSTLLLSSVLLLANLANGPQVLAQDVEKTTQVSETTTAQPTTTQVPDLSQPTVNTAVTESSAASQLHQGLTTQQNSNILSIFYQRCRGSGQVLRGRTVR